MRCAGGTKHIITYNTKCESTKVGKRLPACGQCLNQLNLDSAADLGCSKAHINLSDE
jgi:hypothetical protein